MATQKKPIVRSFEMKKKNIVNRMHPKKNCDSGVERKERLAKAATTHSTRKIWPMREFPFLLWKKPKSREITGRPDGPPGG